MNELLWKNMTIASISSSSKYVTAKIQLLADDFLDVTNRKKLQNKLENWLSYYIKKVLPGLVKV